MYACHPRLVNGYRVAVDNRDTAAAAEYGVGSPGQGRECEASWVGLPAVVPRDQVGEDTPQQRQVVRALRAVVEEDESPVIGAITSGKSRCEQPCHTICG
jgi:hypothetical protein